MRQAMLAVDPSHHGNPRSFAAVAVDEDRSRLALPALSILLLALVLGTARAGDVGAGGVGEQLLGLLAVVGRIAAIWIGASFVATAAILVWFRARARANDRMSQEIRAADWATAAATAEPVAAEPER